MNTLALITRFNRSMGGAPEQIKESERRRPQLLDARCPPTLSVAPSSHNFVTS